MRTLGKILRPLREVVSFVPSTILGGILLLYGMVELSTFLSDRFNLYWLPDDDEGRFRLFVTGCLLIYLGLMRCVTRHPFYNRNYFVWLSLSPWRTGRPLPGGSLHLSWRDLLLLGGFLLLDGRFDLAHAWRDVAMFLLAYMIPNLLVFFFTIRPFAYLLACLSTCFLYVPLTTEAWALVAALLYLFVRGGNQWLLARFPWERPDGTPIVAPDLKAKLGQQLEETNTTAETAGWPASFLLDLPAGDRLPAFDGAALSLLVGWWSFSLAYGPSSSFSARGLTGWSTLAVIIAAVARVMTYCKGTLPPINLWGRLFTFRWILPRHDVVYLPSLAAAALPFGLIALFDYYNIGLMNSALWWRRDTALDALLPGLIAGLGFAIVFLAPPSFRHWRLTGHYRSTKPSSFSQNPKIGLMKI